MSGVPTLVFIQYYNRRRAHNIRIHVRASRPFLEAMMLSSVSKGGI